jgi:hypothetical protein
MKEKKRKRIKVRKTTLNAVLQLKSIFIKANINYSYGS